MTDPPAPYPDAARYAQLAASELGATFTDLDGGQGYVFAVDRGGKRFLSGAGHVCSYPINSASSYGISRDKAHTKSVLRSAAIPVIDGSHFFLSPSFVKLRQPGHERSDAFPYAVAMGYPVFCKPLHGARGDFAEIVSHPSDLETYMARVSVSYDAILIERLTVGNEYRVLVHDHEAILHVSKSDPFIVGDGASTVSALLDRENLRLEGTGVSAYPESVIRAAGLAAGHILPPGVTVPLRGRRNLSAHGGFDHIGENVPARLRDVSVRSCAALCLRLGAVDLFDISLQRDLSELVVIEVNGNPTLRAAESQGYMRLILNIWISMIRERLEL